MTCVNSLSQEKSGKGKMNILSDVCIYILLVLAILAFNYGAHRKPTPKIKKMLRK